MKLGSIVVVLLFAVLVMAHDGYADHFDLIEPVFSEMGLFRDENISVMFLFPEGALGYESIHFHISNKSEHAVTLDWNRSSITLPSGQVSNVAHEGVRFISAGTMLPPTTLPPGGSLLDFVAPTRNIRYSSGVGWLVLPMNIKQGDQFGVYLALEIGDVSRGYSFVFRATEIQEAVEESVEKEAMETVGQLLVLILVSLGLVAFAVHVFGLMLGL